MHDYDICYKCREEFQIGDKVVENSICFGNLAEEDGARFVDCVDWRREKLKVCHEKCYNEVQI